MAREKQTYIRPQPAHRRLTGKQLQNVFSDAGLVSQTPVEQDPEAESYDGYAAFDAGFDGAVNTTVEKFQTVQERREAAFQERRQRQAQAQKPGKAGAIAAVAGDLAAEEAAAFRKETLGAMSKDERNAWFQDLLEFEGDDNRVPSDLSEVEDDEVADYSWADYQAEEARAAELAQQDGVAALAQDLTDDAWAGLVDGDEE